MSMWQAISLYIILVNILAFIVCGMDKRRAKKRAWRISERLLLVLSAIGGAGGMWLGMEIWRHKTKHWYFVFGVPFMFLLQAILLTWLYLK